MSRCFSYSWQPRENRKLTANYKDHHTLHWQICRSCRGHTQETTTPFVDSRTNRHDPTTDTSCQNKKWKRLFQNARILLRKDDWRWCGTRKKSSSSQREPVAKTPRRAVITDAERDPYVGARKGEQREPPLPNPKEMRMRSRISQTIRTVLCAGWQSPSAQDATPDLWNAPMNQDMITKTLSSCKVDIRIGHRATCENKSFGRNGIVLPEILAFSNILEESTESTQVNSSQRARKVLTIRMLFKPTGWHKRAVRRIKKEQKQRCLWHEFLQNGRIVRWNVNAACGTCTTEWPMARHHTRTCTDFLIPFGARVARSYLHTAKSNDQKCTSQRRKHSPVHLDTSVS